MNLEITHLENVKESIKHDHEHLGVREVHESNAVGNDSHLHQQNDLVSRSTAGVVRNSPCSFLLSARFTLFQDIEERREDAGINDGLDLVLVAGCDVADSPGSFLNNVGLLVGEEGGENFQGAGLDNHVSLQTGNRNELENCLTRTNWSDIASTRVCVRSLFPHSHL